MKQKSEKCLYCDQKLEPKTTRQRFCCDKCRVYWNRDNAKVKVSDLTTPTGVLKPQEQAKTNYSINTIPEQKISFYDTPESFMDELQNARTAQELESVGRRIDKSKYPWDIKQRLQGIGRQIYNEKFNF
jgi:hypothetical protein